MKLTYTLIILMIISYSCSKNNENKKCSLSNGKEKTETRNLENFNTIRFDGNITAYLINDTVNKIKIVTGENLIENIISKVKDSTLIIDDYNKCRWLRSYKVKKEVYIYYKKINNILINSQIDLKSENEITTENFEIVNWGDISNIDIKLNCYNFRFSTHAGTGNFNFSGNVQNQFLYFHGTGYIFAKDLKSNYCDITSMTTGNIEIYTENTLIVGLYETGNIIYYGNPTNIETKVKLSSGELIKGD